MSLTLLTSGILTFVCATVLCGTPDPDLFDGRFSAIESDVSGAGNGTDADGESSEGVEGSGSDESLPKVASEGAAEGASEGVAITDGKMSGSGKSGNGSSPEEAATSATGSGRSFEEFEIGAIDKTNGRIEVNQSKEFGEPSVPVSRSDSSANSNMQNLDKDATKSDSGNQETFDGSSAADYGTSVPSGL